MHFRCLRQKYLKVVCIDLFGNVALANLNELESENAPRENVSQQIWPIVTNPWNSDFLLYRFLFDCFLSFGFSFYFIVSIWATDKACSNNNVLHASEESVS